MTVRGYTRPLVEGDDTSGDVAALRELGVDEIVIESSHRLSVDRDRLIQDLEVGDELVVTSLERLARRIDGLISTLANLGQRGVQVRCPEMSAVESSDDTAAAVCAILAAYMEHPLAAEARKQHPTVVRSGKRPGRPRVLDEEQIAKVLELRRAGLSTPAISRELGIGQASVYRVVTGVYMHPARAPRATGI